MSELQKVRRQNVSENDLDDSDIDTVKIDAHPITDDEKNTK